MGIGLALLVSGLVGFLALSYEILWFRVYGFLTGGTSSSFGIVLGSYLLGIAFGSLGARFACDERPAHAAPERLVLPAWLVLLATLGAWILIPGVADVVCNHSFAWTLPAVGVVAGLMGAVLPLVAHFGIPADERTGERLSWIYLANIVGSTTGSLTTGFVLMQYLTTARIALVLALGGLGVAGLLVLCAGQSVRRRTAWVLSLGALAGGLVWATPRAYDMLYEKLLYKSLWHFWPDARFAETVENRSGVINVDAPGKVFGSGVYDGVFSTDPLVDKNGIVRAYAIAAMRPSLPEVLMIGLSSGSWAQVVASNPAVGHLTVIEINPGYTEIDKRHANVQSIFDNPKVTVIYDDGRRWLLGHPERKFDFVASNTTFNWRGYATNLLSGEFLELVKEHLTPAGVLFFNTTASLPVQKTACTHFAHGFRLQNAIAVSEAPLGLDAGLWRERLEAYRIDGKLIFDPGEAAQTRRLDDIVALAAEPKPGDSTGEVESCASILARSRDEPLVTDDNMVTEWVRPWDAVFPH